MRGPIEPLLVWRQWPLPGFEGVPAKRPWLSCFVSAFRTACWLGLCLRPCRHSPGVIWPQSMVNVCVGTLAGWHHRVQCAETTGWPAAAPGSLANQAGDSTQSLSVLHVQTSVGVGPSA